MRITVFYAWQSDSPREANQDFIEAALRSAVTRVAADGATVVTPEVDRDTINVPGAPGIAATILQKINACSIFVGDVSVTYHRREGKPRLSPNPNVLLELGYALPRLGWERVILVQNSALGGPDELPFDLRGNRVMTYECAEATPASAAAALRLSNDLAEQISLILGRVGLPADIGPRVELSIGYKVLSLGNGVRHDYRLSVTARNNSDEVISDWMAVLRFPRALLDERKDYNLDQHQSTRDTAVIRMREQDHSRELIPGDNREVIGIDYYFDNARFHQSEKLFPVVVEAMLFARGKLIARASKTVEELQEF